MPNVVLCKEAKLLIELIKIDDFYDRSLKANVNKLFLSLHKKYVKRNNIFISGNNYLLLKECYLIIVVLLNFYL